MFSLFLSMLLACGTSASVGTGEYYEEPPLLTVTDVDFENTKVDKVCLLAQIHAEISLSHSAHGVSEKNPNTTVLRNAKTDGSYCNRDYVSFLRLTFDGSVIEMVFRRNKIQGLNLKKNVNYCDDCNFGQWTLEKLNIALLNDGLLYQGNATAEHLKDYVSWLTIGVGIKRSFTCDENDTVITIPISINRVSNASNKHEIHSEGWTATIRFIMLRLHPFLVFHSSTKKEPFTDPYLCRDVTLSHVLIILVPFVWFAIFVAFHHIKQRYGCPPDFTARRKKRLESGASTQMEMEESTNVMSGEFEGLAPASSCDCRA